MNAASLTSARFDPATPTEVEGDGWKNMGKNKGKRFIADKTGLQTRKIKPNQGRQSRAGRRTIKALMWSKCFHAASFGKPFH